MKKIKLKRAYIHNSFRSIRYRPKNKYFGRSFEFNPYDDDDHPSVPHGDSLDHHYKIDLKNGDVYEGRKKIGELKKKEFQQLKDDKKIHDIIDKAQAYYQEHHPEIEIAPIPWYKKKHESVLYRKNETKPVVCYLHFRFM